MGFREDFVWGAASSAYQTEGYPAADGGGQSVWDVFCRSPGAIANGEDGSIACDGYHRFEEDIGLLASPTIRPSWITMIRSARLFTSLSSEEIRKTAFPWSRRARMLR